jgi:hypothetical protein
MAQDNVFQGEMDPEIAALLGTVAAPKEKASSDIPDFAHLFSDGEAGEADEADESQGESGETDLTAGGFPEITKRLEEVPHKAFDDPEYYKTALSNEGDIAKRVHMILQKYLNAKDPKDKGVFRQQFIPAYWEFLINVARKAPGRLSDPKKYLLRYGLLHPTFLNPETRTYFSKIVTENTLNQPVYYLDEWFKAVGTGAVKNSSTDEVRVSKSNKNSQLMALMDKAKGKLDGVKTLLRVKNGERLAKEEELVKLVAQITEHYPVTGIPTISSCYSESQKKVFNDVQEILKTLIKADRDQDLYIKDYYQAEEDMKSIQAKMEEEGGAVEIDVGAVDTEFETVRQMVKMTIGRQGNHFPVLSSEYFHCMPNDVATRENVISMLAWIESVDAEAFCRTYKNRLNRIVPYVVLVPSYGDSGMCWEPYDRHNRATSRGRIAVPMYPRSLQIAVLTAVGDLRWQVAKEKASYYWMEEGITGNYYQWFTKMKMKGDLKEAFIQDYIMWMTKESEGTQKLDKELRGAFWRYMPFTQPVKEKLKTRSFVYQELYQRDVNRSMSDGY